MLSKAEREALVADLPFYVNGTLGAAQSKAIEAALPISAALREALAQESNVAHTVREGGKAMIEGTDNSEVRLEALLGTLEDKAPVSAPTGAEPAQQESLGGLLRFLNPKQWHPAVSLALVLGLLVQGAWIGHLNTHVAGLEYQLAAGPDSAQKGSLILQLNPDARWADVQALLGTEGLSIVGGPSDGALTVASTAKGAKLDTLIVRLRASALILAVDKAA